MVVVVVVVPTGFFADGGGGGAYRLFRILGGGDLPGTKFLQQRYRMLQYTVQTFSISGFFPEYPDFFQVSGKCRKKYDFPRIFRIQIRYKFGFFGKISVPDHSDLKRKQV